MTTYQCYYQTPDGDRCPNRQESFWCTEFHEELWKKTAYPTQEKKKWMDKTIAEQLLTRRGYIILSQPSFERFIKKDRFATLRNKGYILQRGTNWFYNKDTWKEAIQQMREWEHEDKQARQQELL